MSVPHDVESWLDNSLVSELRRHVKSLYARNHVCSDDAEHCEVVMEHTGERMRLFDAAAADLHFPLKYKQNGGGGGGGGGDELFREARSAFGLNYVGCSAGSAIFDDAMRRESGMYSSIRAAASVNGGRLDGIVKYGELVRLGSGSFGSVAIYLPRDSKKPAVVVKMQVLSARDAETAREHEDNVARENAILKTLSLNQVVRGKLPTLNFPITPALLYADVDTFGTVGGETDRNAEFIDLVQHIGYLGDVKNGDRVAVAILELAWGDVLAVLKQPRVENGGGAPLSPTAFRTAFFDVASRLYAGYARYGLVHYDIKPANLFVSGVATGADGGEDPTGLADTLVLTQFTVRRDSAPAFTWTVPRRANVLVSKGALLTGYDETSRQQYLGTRRGKRAGGPLVRDVGFAPTATGGSDDVAADFVVHLGDFGFAQTKEYVDTRSVFGVRGSMSYVSATPKFMAPEAYLKPRVCIESPVDNPAADIFALGLSMLDMAVAGEMFSPISFRGRGVCPYHVFMGSDNAHVSPSASMRVSSAGDLAEAVVDDMYNNEMIKFKEELRDKYEFSMFGAEGIAHLFVIQLMVGNGVAVSDAALAYYSRIFPSVGGFLSDMRDETSDIRVLFEKAVSEYVSHDASGTPRPVVLFEELVSRVVRERTGPEGMDLIRWCLAWSPSERPADYMAILMHDTFRPFLASPGKIKDRYRRPDGTPFSVVRTITHVCDTREDIVEAENSAVDEVWGHRSITVPGDVKRLVYDAPYLRSMLKNADVPPVIRASAPSRSVLSMMGGGLQSS